MDENQAAQLLRLGPERVKLGIGQFLAVHAAADRRAAQSELLHRIVELLGGEVRVLQRDRGKGDEAVRLRRAQRGQLLVLQLDELTREVAVGLVPIGVDAQRLDVDALLVHGLDALGAHDQGFGIHLEAHQGHGVREGAMRVHIHGFHAAAVHHHLAASRCRLRVCMRRMRQFAADEGYTSHGAGHAADEVPACGHFVLPISYCFQEQVSLWRMRQERGSVPETVSRRRRGR